MRKDLTNWYHFAEVMFLELNTLMHNLDICSFSKRKYRTADLRIVWRPQTGVMYISLLKGEMIFKNNNDHGHNSSDKSGNVMPRSCLRFENNFHWDAHRPCSPQWSKETFWLVIMQLFCQWHPHHGLQEACALLLGLQPAGSSIINYLSLLLNIPPFQASTCSITTINLH